MLRLRLRALAERRAFRVICAAYGAVGVLILLAYVGGIRLNATASLPLGLYRQTGEPTQYVSFCLGGEPGRLALQRDYVARGVCANGGYPLLKTIVGLPGDVVTLGADGIRINGRLLHNTEPLLRDDWGNPVTHYPFGTYPVQKNTFWVASTYDKRSYDSRYYGPIHASEIVGHLKPVWTTR